MKNEDKKIERTKAKSFEEEKEEKSDAKKNKDMLLTLPFPIALQSRKVVNNGLENFEVLKKVKVNIPLLNVIRQVLTYIKFLKDLCIVKKRMHLKKNFFFFFTKQVSAIIQLIKYKNLGCPTILMNIDNTLRK